MAKTRRTAKILTPAPEAVPVPAALPTAMQAQRLSRLTRIARALMEGKTLTEVASEEGIGRNYAAKLAKDERLRYLMLDWANQEREQLESLYYVGLAQIERGLLARREYLTKDGAILKGGPDHYARIAAVKALCALATIGRTVPKPPEETEEKREITFADLERIVKSRRENAE